MRVLITGATGFIGSHVARRFLGEGCDVYVLLRPDSDTQRISDIKDSLSIVEGDFFTRRELREHLEHIRPEVCLHLAWYVEPGKYLHSRENLCFLSASAQLANDLAELSCKRFVGIGTCFEYDVESGYLSETSPTLPYSLYAASKLSLSFILAQLSRLTGMNVSWLRFFYLYGPQEDQRRLIPSVICSLLRRQQANVTTGEQVRDFLHVEDVAAAVWAVVRSNLSGVVNVGSGQPVTVREVVARIGAILDHPELIAFGAVPRPKSDPMFICANNRLLKEKTPWVPRYDLEEGLRQSIAWWKDRLA